MVWSIVPTILVPTNCLLYTCNWKKPVTNPNTLAFNTRRRDRGNKIVKGNLAGRQVFFVRVEDPLVDKSTSVVGSRVGARR